MKCFVPLYILLGSMLMHVGNAKSASQSCSCVNGVCNCEQQEDQYGNMAGAASMAQTGFGQGPSTYNSAATGNSDTNVINSQSSRTGNADFGDYNPLINGMPGFGNLFGTPFGGVPTGPYGGVPGGPSGGVPGGPSGGVSTGSFSGVSVGPYGAFAGGPFGAVAGGPFGAVAGSPFGAFAGGAIAGFGGFPNTGTFAFAGKKK